MQDLKRKYENKGKEVLDAAKGQYEKMAKRYNQEVLEQEQNILLKTVEKELVGLKQNFINEANKLIEELVKQAEAEDSNSVIKDDMAFMRMFNELSLKYEVMPLHIILDAMNSIESEFEFNIAKRQALKLANVEQQREIYNRFYENPLYTEVKATKVYIKQLEIDNKKFVLPFGINIDSYVTGEDMSQYYFKNRNIEDITEYYFGGAK